MTAAWIKTADNLMLYATENPRDIYPFGSAVTRLIYGITMEFGEDRFRFLRQRISSMKKLNIWEQNLIKVCAKRASTVTTFDPTEVPAHKCLDIGQDLSADLSASRKQHLLGSPLLKDEALQLVSDIALNELHHSRNLGLKLHEAHRPVAAILCDAKDIVLAVGVNTNAACQMRHAEVNLVLQLCNLGMTAFPIGSKLYTSLKPCRMCAGLIHSFGIRENASEPPPLQIFAGEDDPGRFGRHHLLDDILEIKNQR